MKFIAETVALSFLMAIHMGCGDDPHGGMRAKCQAELGLTEDETNEGAISPQPRLGCYLKCLFMESDIMTSEGVILAEKLVEDIGQDIREESEATIYACAEEIKDVEDACVASFQFWECFRRNVPETFDKLGIFGKPLGGRRY